MPAVLDVVDSRRYNGASEIITWVLPEKTSGRDGSDFFFISLRNAWQPDGCIVHKIQPSADYRLR